MTGENILTKRWEDQPGIEHSVNLSWKITNTDTKWNLPGKVFTSNSNPRKLQIYRAPFYHKWIFLKLVILSQMTEWTILGRYPLLHRVLITKSISLLRKTPEHPMCQSFDEVYLLLLWTKRIPTYVQTGKSRLPIHWDQKQCWHTMHQYIQKVENWTLSRP